MSLPKNFHYSQTSLQDFEDCPRRFYLRYLRQIKWPAVQSEPILENEKFTLDGSKLHESIQQYLIGLPEETIRETLTNPRLETWWNAFLTLKDEFPSIADINLRRLPEYTLIGTIDGYKILAKYDLLVIHPDGKIIIYDWKTSHKKPNRDLLIKRLQTKIYPMLLINSGQFLLPKKIFPEDIKMIYWFAKQSGEIETIEYSEIKFHQNEIEIRELINHINTLAQDPDQNAFQLTDDKKKCGFCVYRSLCGTGIQAGSFDDFQDHLIDEITIDFDQISEISF